MAKQFLEFLDKVTLVDGPFRQPRSVRWGNTLWGYRTVWPTVLSIRLTLLAEALCDMYETRDLPTLATEPKRFLDWIGYSNPRACNTLEHYARLFAEQQVLLQSSPFSKPSGFIPIFKAVFVYRDISPCRFAYHFNTEHLPCPGGLENGYTLVDLAQASRLRSVSQTLLYMLLCRVRRLHVPALRTFKAEELVDMLDLGAKSISKNGVLAEVERLLEGVERETEMRCKLHVERGDKNKVVSIRFDVRSRTDKTQ